MASSPLQVMEFHAPGIDLLTFAFEGPHQIERQKPVYIDAEDPSRALNALQLRRLVRRLIAGFQDAGLKKGDSVMVNLVNNIFYTAIYFAIIGAGGVYVGINPANHNSEIEHYLELTAPRFIITSQDLLPRVLPAVTARSISANRIYVINPKHFPIDHEPKLPPSPPRSPGSSSTEAEGCRSVIQLLDHGESEWVRFFDEAKAKATIAAMFFTSGTSGLPKAAMLSHYALVCQHLSISANPPYEVNRLMTLPYFHLFGALFMHVMPIRDGQPLYVLPRFHLHQYVDCIERFGITDTLMAPPMVHALNKSSLPISKLLKSICFIGVGGAPIDASAMQKLQDTLHNTATLTQVWGMSEVGASAFHKYPEQGHLGSIARPLPGYDFRLLDCFGATISSDHEPGELQVRYPGMMTGYKGHEPVEEGSWYSTGDIASRVESRYCIVGRSKELIKVNGFQVSPAEVEATLLTHECINDAAVIGVLRADGVTEVPRAFIIRKSDPGGRCSRLTADEVYAFISSRLASYKRLDGGIVFIDEIPRTASGKIQRFKLSQMDQYRRSITEVLVKNDGLVTTSAVHEFKEANALGRRRSPRLKRGASAMTGEEGRVTKMMTPPKRRRRSAMSLQAKMRALEESSLSTTRHL